MDESGFTGEDLLNPDQPFFVHASTTISDGEVSELREKFFPHVQGPELKHKNLAKYSRGRRSVVEFLKSIRGQQNRFSSFIVHKEFTLLTYLIDLWVEPLLHMDGIDLYKDGANVAMANMTYFCLDA